MKTTKSDQETFDKVVAHLRKQGCKSIKNGQCRYRNDTGNSCAAGCLIPDNDYNPLMEGCSVIVGGGSYTNLSPNDLLATNYFKDNGYNLELLRSLQEVHDNSNVEFWERRLSDIAIKYNLKYSSPNKKD